jgi:hypothetical protein
MPKTRSFWNRFPPVAFLPHDGLVGRSRLLPTFALHHL